MTDSVDLSRPSLGGYEPGRSLPTQAAWLAVRALVFANPIVTSYPLKRWLLRRFGADVGNGVVIKPGLRIKLPWRLSVGENAWLGEDAWIDNLAHVHIGANSCISQGAYLCTGNHDWSDPHMGLRVEPIVIEEGAWVGAFAKIGPGVRVGRNAVVTLGSVLLDDARPDVIYQGNPAAKVRERRLGAGPSPTG